jgi:NitT/TauT family transport system permease protein
LTTRKGRFPSFLLGMLSFCVLLIVWELTVTTFGVRPVLLPPPTMIAKEIAVDLPWYASNAAYTMLTTLIGFALSVIIGVLVAVLLVSIRWFESTIYPLIISFNSVPKVAIAPLFVVWLGTGPQPQIAIAFLIAVFAIIVEAVHGLRSVPPDVMDLGRVLKGSPVDFFFKVRLPSALPSILAGMKVSISLALVGAIVGEFVASQKGLGYVILTAQGSFDTPRVFAALAILGAMGMLLFWLVEVVERKMTHWRHQA